LHMMMFSYYTSQHGNGLQNLFSVSFHVNEQIHPNAGMTKGNKRSRNIINNKFMMFFIQIIAACISRLISIRQHQ
jgi:hypothetical protein